MERTKIQVGEAYGVVPTQTKKARAVAVKATVVELDVAYPSYTRNFGRQGKSDGIRVRFDAPTVKAYDRFTPEVGRERWQGDPFTEYVITSRGVVAPWAEIEAEQARARAADDTARRDTDWLGNVVEPRLENVRRALAAAGLRESKEAYERDDGEDYSVTYTKARGVEKVRIVAAEVEFDLDGIEKLLGLRYAQDVTVPTEKEAEDGEGNG